MAKITNNFIRGGVNKDADERLIPNGSVRDISNAITNVSEGDDSGTLENVLGNVKESDINLVVENEITNPEVIGSVANDSKNLVYYFVKGDDYDTIVEFNSKTNTLVQVLQDTANNILNFDKRITHANVINKASDSGDLERDSDLLAFCGDDNPPRIINIERCKTYTSGNFLEDDINVIKPAPRKAPDLTPLRLNDGGDSLEDKFITFAYRYKYKDGYYSAISSSSESMFTPKAFEINFDTFENEGMVNIFNACDITYNTGNEVVTDIQVLFKESNSSNWYIIEDINKEDEGLSNDTEATFTFKNNKNFRVLPEAEYFRSFDNVPLKAIAQEYAGGRLFYANYEEQRDLVNEDGDKVKLEYTVDVVSEEFNRINIPTSAFNEPGFGFVDIDLTNIPDDAFVNGGRIDIGFDLQERTDQDSFEGLLSANITLPNLEGLNKSLQIASNQDFQNALSAFESFFNDNGFSEPLNTDSISFNASNFNVASPDENTLRISLPRVKFILTNGGGISYIFEEQNTQVNVFTNESSASMKSNRDYEVAMLFLDKEGRKTTALTSIDNTVHVPISASDKKNTLKVTIPQTQKVPEWADRYKFAVKKVGLWETFYSNRFYIDGGFRWIKLEGGDVNKVNVGDEIIVKKDSTEIQNTLGTVKVLDIVDQDRDFIPNNTVEGTGVLLEEEQGQYIKIRPEGFSLDYDESEFINIDRADGQASNVRSERPYTILDNFKIETTDAGGNTIFEDLPFNQGTIFDIIKILSRNDDDQSLVKKTFVSNANYANIHDFITGINTYVPNNAPDPSQFPDTPETPYPTGFFETENDDADYIPYWVVRGEVVLESDTGGSYLIDELGNSLLVGDNNFDDNPFTIHKVRLDNTKPYVMVIKGSESGNNLNRGKLDIKINIRVVDGYYVFETKEKPVSDNIFFETPETYDIVNGEYEQTEHLLSRYFNCYSQGNGAESYQYKDKFNANFLDVSSTPTTTSADEYQKLTRFADITYSGVFNDNTGVNALNEFNLSTANFKDDIDKRYGGIYRLYNRDTNLVLFQEDKVSFIGLGEAELFNADGTANVSRIVNVLGNQRTYSGEYGISKDSESFAQYGTLMYFTDRKRGVVCRLSNNGVFEISSRGLRSYFRNLFNEKEVGQITGSYDDFYNTYVLNLKLDEGKYETWFWKESINQDGGGWVSNQRFNPEDMVAINGNFYTFKDGNIFRHNARDIGIYNTFYSVKEPSKFTIALNNTPNNRKNFKTIELDGSDKWKIDLKTNLSSTAVDGVFQGHVDINDFDKEEGIYRAFIRGNRDVKSINTESLHVQGIGLNNRVVDFDIFFDQPINEEVSVGDYIANDQLDVVGQIVNISSDNVITVSGTLDPSGITNLSDGDFVLAFKPQSIETSGLVGNHLEVSAELDTENKTELFSVSSEVFLSTPKT